MHTTILYHEQVSKHHRMVHQVKAQMPDNSNSVPQTQEILISICVLYHTHIIHISYTQNNNINCQRQVWQLTSVIPVFRRQRQKQKDQKSEVSLSYEKSCLKDFYKAWCGDTFNLCIWETKVGGSLSLSPPNLVCMASFRPAKAT